MAALAGAGLFTLCLPTAHGGPGTGPLELVDAVSEVATGDGAAGWCAGIASTTSSMAAFLEPDVARTIFTTPHTATGGVFAPNGRGVREGNGYRVTGRWQWGSGTQHCEWIVGGAMCDDGTQRVCFFPKSDVEFIDTWYSVGMRGTGSLDIAVSDVFVAEEFTVQPGVSKVFVDEPLAHFPNFTLLALGIAATGLGVARRALDELVDISGAKKPQFSSRTLAQSGFAQTEYSPRRGPLAGGAFAAAQRGRQTRGIRRSRVARSRSNSASQCDLPQRMRRSRASLLSTRHGRSPAARRCTRRACSGAASGTLTS